MFTNKIVLTEWKMTVDSIRKLKGVPHTKIIKDSLICCWKIMLVTSDNEDTLLQRTRFLK